ncbi:acyl-CoA dehydrogenase family protein [Gordonia hydrophobica]|uniref:Acyl-CoA dehydrogenase family protein n=1 Tax=Gordonia hydrophobica TaxID=40516 RepID=A0ABZ2TY14_9ACTN|nr:acyl-CoA dehydrogenase family protein [Gordonia hydrophobica]MBM7366038.1 alkylation response protein AidB-like acyl-CoA dehydrogenase [Gordonia hydrophobica]
MQIAYTQAQEELRAELRTYFSDLMTPERRAALTGGDGELGEGDAYRDVVRQMGRDGWLALGWPSEFGGADRSMMDQLIFTDEAAIAGAPVPFLTINSVAPTIMHYGTEEQKKFFLPKIAAGELHFSIGYSEPGAGTDLAALRTSAVREGDEYVINGQKMWTSLIPYADYVWLACRTDSHGASEATGSRHGASEATGDQRRSKHKGISMVIVPTTAEGFSYTPVHTMAGVDTSATYYQDVRVPISNLVGEEGSGWGLVTNQLNHERVALCSAAPIQTALRDTLAFATTEVDGRRPADQPWVRANLARVHAKVEFLKLVNWKIASIAASGGSPSPADASATKVFGTEFATEAYRLLMEIVGPAATLRAGSPGAHLLGRLERFARTSLILTFGGGTNEVQRDIIGMLALKLPPARR